MHVQISISTLTVDIQDRSLIISGKLKTNVYEFLSISIPCNIQLDGWHNIKDDSFTRSIPLPRRNLELYPIGKHPAIINTNDCILICLKSR